MFAKLSVFFAFSILLTSLSAQAARKMTDDELIHVLSHSEIKKPVVLKQRLDLTELGSDAAGKVADLSENCELKDISVVHVVKNDIEWIGGYEVYSVCEDTPLPGVALYYDVNLRYLGTSSLD